MKVQDVMTRNVAACGVDESLNRAAQLMWECDCGSIPVLDASGSVCGMLTDRDICMAAYTQGLPLTQIPVRNVMSPHLHASDLKTRSRMRKRSCSSTKCGAPPSSMATVSSASSRSAIWSFARRSTLAKRRASVPRRSFRRSW